MNDDLNIQVNPEGADSPVKRGGRPLGSKNKAKIKEKKPYTGKKRGRKPKIRTITAEEIQEKLDSMPSASNSKALSDQLFGCGYGLKKMMEILDTLCEAREALYDGNNPLPKEKCPRDTKALQFVYNALERAHGTIFTPIPQKVELPPNLVLMWNEIKSMPMDQLEQELDRGNGKNRVAIQYAQSEVK